MTITEGRIALVALPGRLDEVRRRIRAGHVLRTLTTAAAVALVTFGFLEFASVSFGLPLDPGGRVAVAAILGLAVGVIGMAGDIVLWPGRIATARRADTTLRLNERLATAVEVAGTANLRDAPVARALLADAERRATLIEPRSLAAIPWRRSAVILVASAAFAAISLAPPDPAVRRDEPLPGGDVATLTAAETAETEAELWHVAAILERDAATRDDPFLEALAREAGRIGEDIGAGRLTDRNAVVAALDRLAGFTAGAYPPAVATDGGSFEAPGLLVEREPEATRILRDLMRERLTPPSVGTDAAAQPEQPMAAPPINAPPEIPPLAGLPQPAADVPGPTTSDGADGEPPPGGTRAPADPNFIAATGLDAFGAPTNYPADQAGERPEDAAPIGPADNANPGQSRFAGAGQGPLDRSTAPPENPFALGEDMLLTGPLDQAGRRIRIEVPPVTPTTAMAPVEATAGDWAPRREVTVARSTLPLAARDLLARYFRPTAEAE